MRYAQRWVAIGVACVAAAACYSKTQQGAEPQPRTTLVVENQAFLDMNIYVLQGSQRIRLGTAGGNATSKFTIPANVVFGASDLRFLADPIGGSRTPVSESITVHPGDEVHLTIPPRLDANRMGSGAGLQIAGVSAVIGIQIAGV